MEKVYDDSPQALFVKEALRKEKPHLSDEELEELWQEKLQAAKRELGDGNCAPCGS